MPPANPVPELAKLAAFVRRQLAGIAGVVGTAASAGRTAGGALTGVGRAEAAARAERVATVVVAPLATFAPTSHARARLLRQAYASGLLSRGELDQALAIDRPVCEVRELPPGA